MATFTPQPSKTSSKTKRANVLMVLHKQDPQKYFAVQLVKGKPGKELDSVSVELPANTFCHHDLLSILSRAATLWNFERPALFSPSGEFIRKFEALKANPIVVAQDLTPEQAKEYTMKAPSGPVRYPILGNIPQLLPYPTLGEVALSKKYGTLFPVYYLAFKVMVIADARAVAEIDHKSESYQKTITFGYDELRRLGGDGLFTSAETEENWGIAHRVMMPKFSAQATRQFIPEMCQVARRLVTRFEKFAADEDVDILSWSIKVTLDTIGLCGFSNDFHAIDKEETPEFIADLAFVLEGLMKTIQQTDIQKWWNSKLQRGIDAAIERMKTSVFKIIQDRKSAGHPRKDYLERMMTATDPKTGKKMTDENIVFNVLTLLIAGHETTASLLSWCFYLLTQNVDVLEKVRAEVEQVCGEAFSQGRDLTDVEVGRLVYTLQTIKEALRLYPSVGSFGKTSMKEDTVCGFAVEKDIMVGINVIALHDNPIYWGPEASKFNPENFSPDAEAKRHPSAYCPFGSGTRSCIGMEFALQEARIIVAMLVYKFDFTLSPSAKPRVVEKIATRPDGLFLRYTKRVPGSRTPAPVQATPKKAEVRVAPVTVDKAAKAGLPVVLDVKPASETTLPPMVILYGSNMGTCQELATEFGEAAEVLGFTVEIAELDAYASNKLASVSLMVIITSTYNGAPPDNGTKFAKWLTKSASLPNLRYMVFGVGNTQWRSYQAFPTKLDTMLREKGARCMVERGAGNVDIGGNMENAFSTWMEGTVGTLTKVYQSILPGANNGVTGKRTSSTSITAADVQVKPAHAPKNGRRASVSVTSPTKTSPPGFGPILRPGTSRTTIVKMENLQSQESGRKSLHVELERLPGQEYKIGDHFALYGENSEAAIEVAVAHIQLPAEIDSIDMPIVIAPTSLRGRTLEFLKDQICSTRSVLRHVPDLHSMPSVKLLKQLIAFCTSDEDQKTLEEWMSAKYESHIQKCGLSLVEILKTVPTLKVPLEEFIAMVPLIAPRLFSIASSPDAQEKTIHLTIGIVDDPSRDTKIRAENYVGFVSGYLRNLKPGDFIIGSPKPNNAGFTLPKDSTQPIVMIANGTGISPFRGFWQHREHIQKNGGKLGPAILIVGCRNERLDELYASEIHAYLKSGVLTAYFPAYSRPDTGKKRYVQDLILEGDAKQAVWNAWYTQKGMIYVCGKANGMAKSVRETVAKNVAEELFKGDAKKGEEFVQEAIAKRSYLQDIWG